jgi:hypothetical protein
LQALSPIREPQLYQVTFTVNGEQLKPFYARGHDALAAVALANLKMFDRLVGHSTLKIEVQISEKGKIQ